MGMFDTIRLDDPLVCPACSHPETMLQTHHFGETLDTYRVGMLIPHCPVLTGILVETFWCSACHTSGKTDPPPVYVVIWHSILVAVEWERETAERKLASVDRLDLIEWLDRAQREGAAWRRKYHALRRDLAQWHEHQVQAQVPSDGTSAPEAKSPLRRLFMPDEEILNAADPLGMILSRHPADEDPEPF